MTATEQLLRRPAFCTYENVESAQRALDRLVKIVAFRLSVTGGSELTEAERYMLDTLALKLAEARAGYYALQELIECHRNAEEEARERERFLVDQRLYA